MEASPSRRSEVVSVSQTPPTPPGRSLPFKGPNDNNVAARRRVEVFSDWLSSGLRPVFLGDWECLTCEGSSREGITHRQRGQRAQEDPKDPKCIKDPQNPKYPKVPKFPNNPKDPKGPQ
ncbi:hypothetical protein EYF80_054009 [Liparis tanakae]|uniref:Uncharacterized protein n=1 Tax=Liparis tanakae TaxID=230148 RepID=A0A4Z2F3M0_9TELE|nr:hypothetical protein EYF80_054009 [Liparis tanakae]